MNSPGNKHGLDPVIASGDTKKRRRSRISRGRKSICNVSTCGADDDRDEKESDQLKDAIRFSLESLSAVVEDLVGMEKAVTIVERVRECLKQELRSERALDDCLERLTVDGCKVESQAEEVKGVDNCIQSLKKESAIWDEILTKREAALVEDESY